MKITRCKTNHIENPIGFDMEQITFSWSVEESLSKRQKRARLSVSADSKMREILLDTGYREDLDNRGHCANLSLSPRTEYFWQVEVEGEKDRAVSEVNTFETGKMDELWQAGWIKANDRTASPYMRRKFSLGKKPVKGRAYIIGLGLYEMEINGTRIGEERLTPYCNAYDAWLQYQTYVIGDTLAKGENAVGVMLGNGWAKGPFGTFGELNTPYMHDFALLCELRITYEDGSDEVIITDKCWRSHPSPILEDSLYDGEVFDANLLLENWSRPDGNDEGWETVAPYSPEGLGPVVDRMSLPVVIKEEIKPEGIITTPRGELVLDMGQNMVGWLRFTAKEAKGTKLVLSHGEVLQDDCFYRDNLRTAKAQYTYFSDGAERIVEPHFTFFGFRYVKLEGFSEPVSPEDFTGCVVYSDLETVGEIKTSDPLVNRLFRNAFWSQKGNFLDVPTDCPQRDERMGWTGDAEVFCGTASFNMDTYAFYSKFMRDLYEEQKFADGMVASTVPSFNRNKTSESSIIAGGACAWSDAATVIPWEVYLHTGDPAILRRQYQSMKDWVDWIIARDKAEGGRNLWTEGFQFGDWLALDGPVKGGVMGGTDHGFLASAYYRLSTNIMAKTASILGEEEDARYYRERTEAVKKAIQDEYFTKSGRSAIGTQTAHVLALHFDLVEEEAKSRILHDLKVLLRDNKMHLKTGFIGTPYLCRSLSDHGAAHEASQIFFQEDFPSWFYEVLMGATTIWERWNSIQPDGKISGTGMNSLNHYAYGSIVEWIYRNVCGLKPVESAPGFKEFIIRPEVNGKFAFAEASLSSPMGWIRSRWEVREQGEVRMEITVPFNAKARVILDGALPESVKGADVPVKALGNGAELTLATGNHTIVWAGKTSIELAYTLDTPLWELKNKGETRQVLLKYFPHFVNDAEEALGFKYPYSIRDLLESTDEFRKGRMLRGADIKAYEKELAAIPCEVRR